MIITEPYLCVTILSRLATERLWRLEASSLSTGRYENRRWDMISWNLYAAGGGVKPASG